MRFGDLTHEEVAAVATSGAVAAVPTGCTEQQGPHITVDFDTWFAETLLVEAAALVGDPAVVVLPALPFGPTPEHRGFGSGYIDVPVEVHAQLVLSILNSLADQGFQKIVVWRGCGGHDLQAIVREFNDNRAGRSRAFLPGHPFHDIWCRIGDPAVPGGHADSFTTSIVMYRCPERLRPDRVPSESSAEPEWADPDPDFARYSPSGVIGSAAHASAELGAALWAESVRAVAELIGRIHRDPESAIVEPTM